MSDVVCSNAGLTTLDRGFTSHPISLCSGQRGLEGADVHLSDYSDRLQRECEWSRRGMYYNCALVCVSHYSPRNR